MSSAIPFPMIGQGSSPHSDESSSSSMSRPPSPSSPFTPVHAEPFIVPIDAALFCARFGHAVARSLAAGLSIRPATPLVRWDRLKGTHLVTLPLIALYVPHPPSIPHLLFFGQNLPLSVPPDCTLSSQLSQIHLAPPSPSSPTFSISSGRSTPSSPSLASPPQPAASALTPYLLPTAAIEEFPSAPGMAAAMARTLSPDALRSRCAFNQGLWRNVLLLAPTDATVADAVHVAWNVAADARRLASQRNSRQSPSRNTRPREPVPPLPTASDASDTTDEPLPTVSVSVHRVGESPARPELPMREKTVYLAPVPIRKEVSRQRSREVIRQASREFIRQGGRELRRQGSREVIRRDSRELIRQRSHRDLLSV